MKTFIFVLKKVKGASGDLLPCQKKTMSLKKNMMTTSTKDGKKISTMTRTNNRIFSQVVR